MYSVKSLSALLLIFFAFGLNAQQIFLDDSFDDWNGVGSLVEDRGDATGLDIESLQISSDNKNLYVRIKLDREILLQENNNIALVIDFDNNPNTGYDIAELGAEFYFIFGARQGSLFGSSVDIYHDDAGLISSPTVSGDEFEIALSRTVESFTGVRRTMEDEISVKVFANNFSGDTAPNGAGGYVYRLSNRSQELAEFSIPKVQGTDFRFLSYNVLRDNLFDNGARSAYRNILQAIDADIICFQEIYDNTAPAVLNHLEDLSVIHDADDWNAVKHGPDIITVSRYPIVYHEPIWSNGFIVIDVEGTDVAIFNLHLPCCENDDGREREIDQILEFIRESMEGREAYTIMDDMPIIICGDMNFVGFRDQVEALKTGNIFNNTVYGEDVVLDSDMTGLEDLVPATTGFTGSFTWNSPSSSFFPGRLDYIFYKDSRLESLNSFVLNTAGLTSDLQYDYQLFTATTLVASDHLPVVSDFSIRNTDAVADFAAIDATVYPNPSSGVVNIRAEETFASVQVYDISGQLILNENMSANQTQVTLAKGIYKVKLYNKKGAVYSQLIVVE